MTSQLDLRWDLLSRFRNARDRLYASVQYAAAQIPFDHLVLDTDAKPSSVSHGLRRENGHRSSLDTTAYLLVHEKCGQQLLETLCAVRDQRPVPIEMSAAEKVARYEAELARLGDVGAAIKRNALAGGR